MCFIASSPSSSVTVRSMSGRFAPGDKHRHTLFVSAIIITKLLDQITLFQEYPYEDVGSRCGCKEQMPDSHLRRGPEGDDEAQIDRMTHQLVVHRRPELWRRHVASRKIGRYLLQSEQFEMIDQECAGEHDRPADQ